MNIPGPVQVSLTALDALCWFPQKKEKKRDNFDFKSTYYGSECSGQGNNYIIYTQQRHLKGRKQTFTANEWLNIIKIV